MVLDHDAVRPVSRPSVTPRAPSHGRSPDRSDVERLLEAYPRIYFACHTRHVRDPGTGHGLSAHQASLLSHLDEVDPTTVSELAEHMGVTLSTMSLAVKRLVRNGYVERSPSPDDGRVVHLRLTDNGARVRSAQSVLDPGRVRLLLEQLGAEERERGLEGLELLASAAGDALRAWREAEKERNLENGREVA